MADRCTHCSGFGRVTVKVTDCPIGEGYFREVDCEECDGSGEVEPTCPCCERELDSHGFCEGCQEYAIEPARHVLTDRIVKRKAA